MAGTVTLTADGAVLKSGKPIRLYGFTMKSAASGPGVAIFYNGTDTTGTELFRLTGQADGSPPPTNFGESGLFFPAGLYVDIDADVSALNLNCELVSA